MYITNFSFLAHLGGELCEKQIQKIRKIEKKHHFFGAALQNTKFAAN